MPDKGDSLMFGFIGNIGPWELIFILLIALIVVGPGKLPEVAKGIGKATREFKKATSGVQREINEVMRFDEPNPVKKEYEAIKNSGQETASQKPEPKTEEKYGEKEDGDSQA